jgi:hypothetical protein
MKVTKNTPDKRSGTESNPYGSTSTVASRGSLSETSKPGLSQNDKGKRPQASERPSSLSKPADGVKKIKKKAVGGDEPWPFASITPQDLENEIRERAFFIFLQRGTEGDPLSDWLQAEAEIKRKYGIGI